MGAERENRFFYIYQTGLGWQSEAFKPNLPMHSALGCEGLQIIWNTYLELQNCGNHPSDSKQNLH